MAALDFHPEMVEGRYKFIGPAAGVCGSCPDDGDFRCEVDLKVRLRRRPRVDPYAPGHNQALGAFAALSEPAACHFNIEAHQADRTLRLGTNNRHAAAPWLLQERGISEDANALKREVVVFLTARLLAAAVTVAGNALPLVVRTLEFALGTA